MKNCNLSQSSPLHPLAGAIFNQNDPVTYLGFIDRIERLVHGKTDTLSRAIRGGIKNGLPAKLIVLEIKQMITDNRSAMVGILNERVVGQIEML